MPDYVIALEPGRKLSGKIRSIKKKAKRITGPQKYLADAPHCTLMVVNSGRAAEIKEELAKACADLIAPGLDKIELGIRGWFVFSDDVITGNETLVAELERRSQAELAKIQEKTVIRMSRLRSPGLPERYAKARPGLPKDMRESLKKFGYPFVGRGWKPHMTIASFDKPAFAGVWKALKDSCPKGRFKFGSAAIYRLGKDEKLTLVKRWPLKGRKGA